ncbi:MAG: hypothetical protein NWE91_06500 [Candidatus Bathyarchaeota archaeon]|nr:hypothetical protein [Candidatus Bathyarchaeota archaeon]
MSFRVKPLLTFAAFILLVFGSCARFRVFGANETDAVAAIAAAEEKNVLCYDAVAEADGAGANVTVLLVTLGEAGGLLSMAEWSYARGDFDNAVDFAGQSQGKLNGFVVEAEALTETVVKENYWGFLVNVVGSVVGSVAVVCGSFVVWHFFKKRYGGGVGA